MDCNKPKQIKECSFCEIKAIYLCFQCRKYFCENCFKIIHDLKNNFEHKKELIDPFIPIEINCSEHPNYPLELFCLNDKGKII